MPIVGKRRNLTEKISTRTIPNQKGGIDCPNVATTFAAVSIHVPLFRAAITPRGRPKSIVMARAAAASFTELGSLSLTRSETGLLDFKDLPKSPLVALAIKL